MPKRSSIVVIAPPERRAPLRLARRALALAGHATSVVWLICLSLLVAGERAIIADEPASESAAPSQGEAMFLERVAPLLQNRCLGCHRGLTARGGVSLATRAELFEGGDNGPVIVSGQPDESRLIEVLTGEPAEMPAEGAPLSADEVELLRDWVAAGAPWAEGRELQATGPRPAWWSLEPIRPVEPPASIDPAWVLTPVDAFIRAALSEQGLEPSPEADRRTLIRRLTFDLHGLPPTIDEVEQFLADSEPGAYERLVDRLLASPRYGECWARHWLDVVHFGETHGYDKDKRREHAWPYRDYVIQALNKDLPYGEFIRQQVAGDVGPQPDRRGIIATGFIAAGPWDFVGHVELGESTVEKAKTRSLDRDDMVATVMSSVCSVTIHCARCHDHPFDPFPQQDYYRLQAVFAGVDRGDRELPAPATGEEDQPKLVYAVRPIAPRTIRVLYRGNIEAPGDEVGPGSLSAIAELPSQFELAAEAGEGARRAALADWLTDPRNPLTWRSIVNRVWQFHFGAGLVDTPSDFGRNGSLPTHPELLDWLAGELLARGQSLKSLHRLLVTSRTYRQQSAPDLRSASSQGAASPTVGAESGEAPIADERARRDADNRWWWRAQRRRLEAEQVRDAVLAVSGKLDLTPGGPSFVTFDFEDDHSPRYRYNFADDPARFRRSVYRFLVRSVPDPFFESLDCADPSTLTPVRNTTLTALQSLALWNNPFMLRQAEYFAQRLAAESPTLELQIERMYRHALARPPRAEEAAACVAYARHHGLPAACRVMLNTSEFLFVD